MNKFKPTEDQLIKIGFKKVLDERFEIYFKKGVFCYNRQNPFFYQKTNIGCYSTYLILNINSFEELYTLLSIFNVEFNLIII